MSHAEAKRFGSYGKGTHNVDFRTEEIYLNPAAVEARMLDRFRQPGYRPPILPAIALKLMEFGRGGNIETTEIVALLEQDPMLAAHIVKVANSPVYGNVTRIRGIRDAVVRLGRVNLMNCVMEVAVSSKIFRVDGYEEVMARLAVHSRATGHLAKVVSNYTWASDDFVFLCGLLHDVGLAGILISLGDVPRGKTVPRLDLAMLRAIDSIHCEASAILCDLWGLPQEISLVIGKHHDLLVDGYPHPIASVVCLAEHLANMHALGWTGSSMSTVDRSSQRVILKARQVLKIDDKKWELIQDDARTLLASM